MKDAQTRGAQAFQIRIVGGGNEAPDQLLANPWNWRIHPRYQQEALKAALTTVGWVQNVIVNRRTGHVVDGHARVSLALKQGEELVPVVYVDLSEDEEKLVLATLDPIAAMAGASNEALGHLLASLPTIPEALAAAVQESAAVAGGSNFDEALSRLSREKGGFRQMAFIVSDEQYESITAALTRAAEAAKQEAETSGNQNRNGNALAAIARGYAHVSQDA